MLFFWGNKKKKGVNITLLPFHVGFEKSWYTNTGAPDEPRNHSK